MGLFGMSESELKKFAEELKGKELELQNKESDVERNVENAWHERSQLNVDKEAFAKERQDFAKEREAYLAERTAFEARRQEVLRLETEAKAGFVKAQEQTFEEVIEKRLKELDAREANLNERANKIAEEQKKVIDREGDVAKREFAVTEREQKADAGFADKASVLAKEAERQHDANVQEANRLREQEEQLTSAKAELEKSKKALGQRENAVTDSELKRDAGYNEERAALDSELNQKRAAWQTEERALHEKLIEQETNLLADLDKRLAEVSKQRHADMETAVENERKRMIEAVNKEVRDLREQIAKERTENREREGRLAALEDKLESKASELEARERDLNDRRDDIETEVSERTAERRSSYESLEAGLRNEIDRLRDSVRTQEDLLGTFEELKRNLGDRDAAEVLRDLDAKTAELKDLREKLSQPNEEQRVRIETLENSVAEQKARADEKERELEESKAEIAEAAALKRSLDELTLDKESLQRQLKLVTEEASLFETKLHRLTAGFERPSEVAARYQEIEMPVVTSDEFKAPVKSTDMDEMDWLLGIQEKCGEYGYYFPLRIFKAFHTSLKTSQWSPITVLAGVSGTGKSKLPELYSCFGGLEFDLLDVQPNWDSQEAMLGYFNSIDNKFDAQHVLKLLAQSQIPSNETYEKRIARWREMAGTSLGLDPEKDKELISSLQEMKYPGLADCMSLVLLDEMNLAHPELYFAGFLSKLEQRSDKAKSCVPFLEVKIGAGLPPYRLPLGRNVLWVGTMNQDETTKSLSDKVLDRSTVIFFPRPKKLVGREVIKVQNDKAKAPRLHKATFDSWIVRDCSAISEFVEPYKAFVEKINDAMGSVGRAVGHRVWQSIEYYMANYPDVRVAVREGKNDETGLKNALHVAFEDQLVQKVMPKLRGIDCRGDSKSQCLDKIRELLTIGVNGGDFKLLVRDFDLAQKLGYGQFMWQSAEYLDEEVIAPVESVQTKSGKKK